MVVFARDDGKLSPVDALRARSILHASILVIVGGVAPLTLEAYGFSADKVLHGAAAICLFVGIIMSAEGAAFNMRMDPADRQKAGYIHGAFSWGLSFLALVLLAIIVFRDGAPVGHYIMALSLGIAVASSNFVMIALQKWLSG